MTGTQSYVEQVLIGTTSSGVASEVTYPCKVLSRPRRSVGIKAGDTLSVRVKRRTAAGDTPSDIAWPPSDWDLNKPIALRLRYWDAVAGDWDAGNTVTLGGYRLDQAAATGEGVVPNADPTTQAAIVAGTGGTWEPHEWDLLLSTLPALWADGGGGLIRRRVYNPLLADGSIDSSVADSYKTNSQLLTIAITDLGLTPSIASGVVTSLDAFDRARALDWGNRPALHEIDALCARLGHECSLSLDGATLHVFRLPRGGEPLATPAIVSDNANPYVLATSASLRGQTIVVTSGDTRAQVVTDRTMSQLEWVWFDSRTGRWLSDAETASLYAGEIQPGDINALRAGPPKDPKAREQWSARLFRGLRVADAADRRATSRFVAVPQVVNSGAGNQMGRVPCVVEINGVTVRGAQLVSSGSMDRVDGARTHAGHGVIELPPRVIGAKITSAAQGGYNDCVVLGDSDLRVTFAYEVASNVYGEQYYVKAFSVAAPSGADTEVAVTALSGVFEAAAILSPFSVKVHAPWLVRVGSWPSGGSPTWANTAALDAAALAIAKARASAGTVQGGVIELRGLKAMVPGIDWPWASRVEWDPSRMLTYVIVGGHEMRQSEFDALESEVRRSAAAGLGRFSAPGSAAAVEDVSLGATPGQRMAGSLHVSGIPVGLVARGMELAAPLTPASVGGEPVAQASGSSRDSERWLARITGSTAISGASNRWEYDWQEVGLRNDRTAADSGRTHASSGYGKAVNLAELRNTGGASGVQGNQVDLSQLTGTSLTIRPITGLVVEMSGPYGTSAAPYCVFSAANGLAGACA